MSIKLITVATAFVLAICCTGCLNGYRVAKSKNDGAVLTGRTDLRFHRGEEMDFCLILSNGGPRSITWANRRGYRDCFIVVTRTDGEIAPYTELGWRVMPQLSAGATMYTELPPGEIHTWHYNLDALFRLRPGKYVVDAKVEIDAAGKLIGLRSPVFVVME